MSKTYSGSFDGSGSAHGGDITDSVTISGDVTMKLKESGSGQITGTFSYHGDMTVTGTDGFTKALHGTGTVSGHGSTLDLTSENTKNTHIAEGKATIHDGTIKFHAGWHGSMHHGLLTASGSATGTLHGPNLTAEAANFGGAIQLSQAIASIGDGGGLTNGGLTVSSNGISIDISSQASQATIYAQT
jgi:hypothetical protein